METQSVLPKKVAEAADGPQRRAFKINSESLFRDADVVYIEHNGETYTLRKTRQEKLILTK